MVGIDFHQHVWPDALRRALERRREPPYLRRRELVLPVGGVFEVDPDAYAPESRIDELDRNGLELAVVSLPPTTEPTPDLVEVWHREANALRRSSGGRLLPLACESALSGFPGAIIGAPHLGRSVELLSKLESLGQFAFVHPAAAAGDGRGGWIASGVAYSQQMLAAYADWIASPSQERPRVVFALLGGGAPFQIERLMRRGLDARAPFRSDIWFETSSYGTRSLELSLQTFGAGRLLFGSDAPVDAVADARQVTSSFGVALELELLVSNPLEILGSERARWAA